MLNSADEKMTIFYSKRTGEIKAYTTGITDFGYFGEDAEDMKVIYSCKVVDLDNYVLENIAHFKVEGDRIKLKDDVNLGKYL